MLAKLATIMSAVALIEAQTVPQQIVAAHAQAAREAERQNDFRTAVREYEYVTSQLPRNAEMQSNLGVALYFDGQLRRAIVTFQKAMALEASLPAPHLFSGLAWYRLSNPDKAVPELERAVRLNSSDVIARTWLGYAYVAQSRHEDAFRQFQAACQMDSNNIDVWYALGQTYLQIGMDATSQLLVVAPDGGRAWQLAGEQWNLRGNRRQALDDFEKALERRPDISELRTLVAEMGGTVPSAESKRSGATEEDDLYRRAHDAEQQAREAFEQVAQLAPNSYRAHQIMADSLTAEQRPDEAVGEYQTVLKLKPDLPGIHETVGKILLQSGKLAGALREFEAELQIEPDSSSARTNTGEALLLMGRDEEAGKMLAGALQMDRPPPKIYRLLGKMDLRRKEYHSAVDALTHYVSIKKDDSTAYFLLAKAYQGLGDQQRTEHAFSLYRTTSEDAKARSRAQTELEKFNNPNEMREETADLNHSTAH